MTSWLHEKDGPVAHSLARRDWDHQYSHCGRKFDHDERPSGLKEWSQPCPECWKERERRDPETT